MWSKFIFIYKLLQIGRVSRLNWKRQVWRTHFVRVWVRHIILCSGISRAPSGVLNTLASPRKVTEHTVQVLWFNTKKIMASFLLQCSVLQEIIPSLISVMEKYWVGSTLVKYLYHENCHGDHGLSLKLWFWNDFFLRDLHNMASDVFLLEFSKSKAFDYLPLAARATKVQFCFMTSLLIPLVLSIIVT